MPPKDWTVCRSCQEVAFSLWEPCDWCWVCLIPWTSWRLRSGPFHSHSGSLYSLCWHSPPAAWICLGRDSSVSSALKLLSEKWPRKRVSPLGHTDLAQLHDDFWSLVFPRPCNSSFNHHNAPASVLAAPYFGLDLCFSFCYSSASSLTHLNNRNHHLRCYCRCLHYED